MIPFRKLMLQDKQQFDSLLMEADRRSCEYSFANLFLWGKKSVAEQDGFLLLADGKRRKLEHPKRKNPRHVCPVLTEGFDHRVIRKLQEGTPVTNRELRQALAAFKEGITLG